MPQLRLGPSGPPIVGNNVGDVLVWDGAEWVPGSTTGGTAWDHVVSSLADLPAPVAGVIELTDGSWAFKAPIDLGANVLSVPSGVSVLMKGMGGFNEKVLSGDASRVLLIEGNAHIETLTIEAVNGAAVELATNASLASLLCEFDGDAQGVTMSAGLWRDSMSRVVGDAEAMVMTGGRVHLSQTRFLSGTSECFDASGASVTEVWMQGCLLQAPGASTVVFDCPAGTFVSEGTAFECDTGNPVILSSLALGLQLVGGRLQGTAGIGVQVAGNITRHLQLVGVQGAALSSFLSRTAGTVRQATVQGCSTFSDVAVGITWAAASAPTNGLSVVGNTFDTATPLSGFTAASARCNLKANVSAGALMQETAIVP